MAVQSIPIKDGVVDIVYSPDDGGYYVQKTLFSQKSSVVSKRIYTSAGLALAAYRANRVRWER